MGEMCSKEAKDEQDLRVKTNPIREEAFKSSHLKIEDYQLSEELQANNFEMELISDEEPLKLEPVNEMNAMSSRVSDSLSKINKGALLRSQWEQKAGENSMSATLGPFRCSHLKATYQGSLKDNKPSGWGRAVTEDGQLIEGEFSEGYPGPYVMWIKEDGRVYLGETKKGLFQGTGALASFETKTIIEGQFLNSVLQEDSVRILPLVGDDYVFVGESVDGKMSKGVYTKKNEYVYEGSFLNNKADGKGKKTFKNGSVYEGAFSNGEEEGFGTLTYVDGRVYRGPFVKGKQHGLATFITDEGVYRKQEWKNGIRIGTTA